MYISTFYSFKGGVGRSMALVNVAYELAKNGRRVLMVDFDLEAPGLDTFRLDMPHYQNGLIDYVHEYVNTSVSPDVKDYIYKTLCSDGLDGEIWVMPAGQHKSYAESLASLDWQELYEKHSGYLFVEDLKAQWQAELNPDYVLIDSRTGHTEVGGICTRQLPNLVVFLFFPNDQNLHGLDSVVKRIRENSGDTQKIEMLFVTSNVPDLDDEDQILSERLAEFSDKLGYKNLDAEIHSYNSLALLNQVVFTKERPNTRLAQEYRELCDVIVSRNMEDRVGALGYLTEKLQLNSKASAKLVDAELADIIRKHPRDSEILLAAGSLYERLGRHEDAYVLINRSVKQLQYVTPSSLLAHARASHQVKNNDAALADLTEILSFEDVGFRILSNVVSLLANLDVERKSDVLESKAFLSLEPYEAISILETDFISKVNDLPLAESTLVTLGRKFPTEADLFTHELMLVKIGLGKFDEAMDLSAGRPDSSSDVVAIFNYAIAEWGMSQRVPDDLFSLVVNKLDGDDDYVNANRYQCLTLSHWALADLDAAKECAEMAVEEIQKSIRSFSCWTYLYRNRNSFMKDMSEMTEMINGESVLPPIFSRWFDGN